MLTGTPEDQNSYQGELGGQLGFICAIKIMYSQQLRQNKRPQMSDNPPRSSKIEMETGITYLTYV